MPTPTDEHLTSSVPSGPNPPVEPGATNQPPAPSTEAPPETHPAKGVPTTAQEVPITAKEVPTTAQEAPTVEAQLDVLQKQVADLERLARQHQSERDKAQADLTRERQQYQTEVKKLKTMLREVPITNEQREAIQAAADRAELEAYRQVEQVRQIQAAMTRDYGIPPELFDGITDANETAQVAWQHLYNQQKALTDEVQQLRTAKKPAETPPVPGTGQTPLADVPPSDTTDKSAWIKERAKEIVKTKYKGKERYKGRAGLEAEREWLALQQKKGAQGRKAQA